MTKLDATTAVAPRGFTPAAKIFRQMADMSSDAFFLTDREGQFLYVNARGCKLSGYSFDQLRQMKVPNLSLSFPPERFREIVERLGRGPVAPFESLNRRPDGSTYLVEVSVARIDANQEVCLFGVARDITERKRTEARLESFSRSVLTTLEAERRRVARELHDGVGQELAFLGLQLNSLRREKRGLSDDVRLTLAKLEENLGKTVESVARLVRDHHPTELSDLGAACAIATFAREFGNTHGLNVSVSLDSLEGLLSEDRELHLYRIVQEALNNVVKHARATRVEVEVTERGATLIATVRDNGRGFPPDSRPEGKPAGLGLTTIRERAQILGGSLRVETQAGRGTALIVTVPLVRSAI